MQAALNTPAAFGRLCVETLFLLVFGHLIGPAAFGRLCVETFLKLPSCLLGFSPAAFGRLCVETYCGVVNVRKAVSSRLRAAVC